MYLTTPASFMGDLVTGKCKAPPALLASATMLVTEWRREEGQAQSTLAGGRSGVGEGAVEAKLGTIWGREEGDRVLTWSSMVGGSGHGRGPKGAKLVNTGGWEAGATTGYFSAGAKRMSRSSYSSGEMFKAWLLRPCLAVAPIDACRSDGVAKVDVLRPCRRHTIFEVVGLLFKNQKSSEVYAISTGIVDISLKSIHTCILHVTCAHVNMS